MRRISMALSAIVFVLGSGACERQTTETAEGPQAPAEPRIRVEGNQDGDWKQEEGYAIMETALQRFPKIDVVYAHNDPMAFGAYLAARDAGREKEIKFIGIDAIPKEGCQWVKNGQLAATFVYPPPGAEGLRTALKILNGEAVEKRRMLPTKRITKENVDEYLEQVTASDSPATTATAETETTAAGTTAPTYVIGFSQCTTTEPWRVLFNHLLIAEAAKHPEVKLIVLDAQDSTPRQVTDMESFINRKVDAILISPKESAGLTDVVEQATEKGIPVIVLDRDVETDKYAAFIGGDNLEIGREAGRYAVEILGGEGRAKGFIYEIWGGKGSTPAHERHDGFHEIINEELEETP